VVVAGPAPERAGRRGARDGDREAGAGSGAALLAVAVLVLALLRYLEARPGPAAGSSASRPPEPWSAARVYLDERCLLRYGRRAATSRHERDVVMSGNLPSPRRRARKIIRPGWRSRCREVGALAASGALVTAVSLAVLAPGAMAAPASARSAVIVHRGKVTCTRRPKIQPPPLGVLKAVLARRGAGQTVQAAVPAITIKPVCPVGEIPVVRALRKGLPNGNPDQARLARGHDQGLAGRGPQAPAGPPCDGTFEDGYCYYWAGATDSRTDQGGGHTMTIEKPVVVGAGHALEELSVQAGKSGGNIVEIGSSVSSGDPDPELFVFHWLNWNPTCYDGCGYQQYSNTYYPGMDLSPLVGHQVYDGYVFYQGSWWAWFNDQWLGYFPGSLWDGQFQASQQVQWFGEVATNNGVPPFTQMGDGLFASSPHAAPMSTLCDVNAAAWRCFYYDQQSLYQTGPKFYTVAHTGFGAIRLGGPGS